MADFKKVDSLVAMRADVATADPSGNTALHWGALHGHTEIVARLLDGGAPISAADIRGWTPLHVAAGRGHSAAVGLMLARGSSSSCTQNLDGATARDVAAAAMTHSGAPQADAVRLLISAERLAAEHRSTDASDIQSQTMVWHRCEWRSSCATHTCPYGLTHVATADRVPCGARICTEDDTSICCIKRAACTNFTCQDSYLLKDNASDILCAGRACMEADNDACCDERGKCASLSCPDDHIHRVNSSERLCAAQFCEAHADAAICCEARAPCSSLLEIACPVGFGLMTNASTVLCAAGTCTEADVVVCCTRRESELRTDASWIGVVSSENASGGAFGNASGGASGNARDGLLSSGIVGDVGNASDGRSETVNAHNGSIEG
eukprot:TRINITY_DN33384_c0_g1_i1.p1 TRINITY_DN33384_c0_g1~~TRINITY_DN33384_c0_g1_i1.p1  ORF type:complete len:433 (+),score=59.25 TRINITY_DN33384_c0_g1_i1:161-1300(+)